MRPRSCRWSEPPGSRTLLVVFLLAGFALSAAGQPAFVERPEEELLLLQVTLDRQTLADIFPAWMNGEGLLIPLGELSRILDLAIEVDLGGGTASGWILQESRVFALDARRGTVMIQGASAPFDRSMVEIHQDDIYVDSRLLSEWLPISFTPDLYAAQLRLKAREPLPIQLSQQRLARERGLQGGADGPRYDLIETPYSAWDGPFLDHTLSIDYAEESEELSLRHSSFLSGDLLWGELNAYVAGDGDDPLQDTRVTFGRRDPGGTLLGPLRAREALVGDIYAPASDLLVQGTFGPGLLISNISLERPLQFDAHTFRGDLPAGWEVELYRNNVQLGYQRSRPDGLYEFEEVPLLFGLNVFRVVFYGPQGQQREELVRFNVQEALTPPGSFEYRAWFSSPEDYGDRALFEANYGLARGLNLHGAVAAIGEDRDAVLVRTGVSGYLGQVFGRASLAADDEGRTAYQLTAHARFGPVTGSFHHASAPDWSGDPLDRVFEDSETLTAARFDAVVPLGEARSLPVSLELERFGFASGEEIYELTGRVATNVRRTAVSNELTGLFGSSSTLKDRLLGSLLVSRYVGRVGLRGGIEYGIRPDAEVRLVELGGTVAVGESYLVQGGVRKFLSSDDEGLYLNLTRSRGRFGFLVNTAWNSDRGAVLSAGLVVGLASRGWGLRPHTTARTIATQGAVDLFVFLDEDGDGELDPGERPLPDVGFFIQRASRDGATDDAGRLFLPSLPAYREVEVSVSVSTLPDPLWIPMVRGVRVVPRPGKAIELSFPILKSGVITGTIRVDTPDGTRELSGARLLLNDAKGTTVATATSGFDGFYEMTDLRAGEYALTIDPAQEEKLGLERVEPKRVVVEGGEFTDGADLLLRRLDDQK